MEVIVFKGDGGLDATRKKKTCPDASILENLTTLLFLKYLYLT